MAMDAKKLSAKERIVLVSAERFRSKGYHGVGLSEILEAADVPKGSLYHHFPNGKADVALAAADLASHEMMRIIDDSFSGAGSPREGVTTLCFKLAKLFDLFDRKDGCPVSTVLFDAPDNMIFRNKAKEVFNDWISCIRRHGEQLGLPSQDAFDLAEMTLIALEGAWILARARESSDLLRKLPQRLFSSAG